MCKGSPPKRLLCSTARSPAYAIISTLLGDRDLSQPSAVLVTINPRDSERRNARAITIKFVILLLPPLMAGNSGKIDR